MFKKNENAILRRTERVMVRVMCGQKTVDKKTTGNYIYTAFKKFFFSKIVL